MTIEHGNEKDTGKVFTIALTTGEEFRCFVSETCPISSTSFTSSNVCLTLPLVNENNELSGWLFINSSNIKYALVRKGDE